MFEAVQRVGQVHLFPVEQPLIDMLVRHGRDNRQQAERRVQTREGKTEPGDGPGN